MSAALRINIFRNVKIPENLRMRTFQKRLDTLRIPDPFYMAGMALPAPPEGGLPRALPSEERGLWGA